MSGMKSLASLLRIVPAWLSGFAVLLVLTAGCASIDKQEQAQFSQLSGDSPGSGSEALRPGDMLKISFRGPSNPIPDFEERIPESGQINLPLIGKVDVVGKTRVQLQDEIHGKYVDRYFKELTVTIDPADRYFFVYGEVKFANRYPYGSKLTVTGAISTAQGFTDFANQKKVLLIRTDGKREIVNCKKARDNPEFDPEVLPGDRIFVPRRLW